MARTFIRQDTQIRKSDLYDDTIVPTVAAYETNPTNIEEDLNAVRSQLQNFLNRSGATFPVGNWWDDTAAPVTFENGAARGINTTNQDLHDLEHKRILVDNLVDNTIVVPASAFATATFTSTGAFANNETVSIGGQTYTFKTPFVDAANNIDASVSTAQTHENLRRAINLQGVAGTNYGTGTLINASVSATDTASSNVLTAKTAGAVGNNILTSDTAANASFTQSPATHLINGAGDVGVLTLGQLPTTPYNIAAIGSVTTLGSVAATNTNFGAHSLALVTGGAAVSPKNLVTLYDQATLETILSGGRTVYALFQVESSTDGSTMTGTTPNRAQLSFVRVNAGDTALEPVPVADIAGKTVDYVNVIRKYLLALDEQDFLRGTASSVPTGTSVTRQIAYDQQGVVPVELTTNATLDLKGAGEFWKIRDLVNADLLTITEGSTGGTTTLQIGTDVDTFDVNAVVNDFRTGIKASTGSQEIDIGVTAGVIESTGANNLRMLGAVKLKLDDSYQPGSTWVATDGISLADTSPEWTAFKVAYGEVSLLSAITTAKNTSSRFSKVYSNVTVNTNADTDVSLADGNLDTALPAMNLGSYLTDYDVFLNGNLLRPDSSVTGANNHDYYPGSSTTAPAKIKFEFKVKANDVLCVIPYA